MYALIDTILFRHLWILVSVGGFGTNINWDEFVVKFWGTLKLYMDFDCVGIWHPSLSHSLFKCQLCIQLKLKYSNTEIDKHISNLKKYNCFLFPCHQVSVLIVVGSRLSR